MRTRLGLAVLAAVTWTATSSADMPPDPRLTAERRDASYVLRVDVSSGERAPTETIVRETDVEPVPVATGWGPDARTAFVAWAEAGERWFSYSRDRGRTWSEARSTRMELRLRGGDVGPSDTLPAVPAGLSLPAGGRVFLVQLKTVSLPEWRAGLERGGAAILASLPHNGHVVRVEPSAVPYLSTLPFVERVEPMHPAYRLEPELRSWMQGAADPRETSDGELRVRVMAFEWGPSGKQSILEAAERAGARAAGTWPHGHVLELWVRREHLAGLAAHDHVMWIDRWTERETDMNLVRDDAGSDWLDDGFGLCGQGVRGEVLDVGIQQSHPDFTGLLAHGPLGEHSHGTSTYGIVFGNGSGDPDATGHLPCPEAQGIAADTGSLGGDRFGHTQELKGAPYFASFQTNSWGDARTTEYTSVSAEMDDIIFRLDIAITQSQSNAGNRQSRPQAWAKNIISVGGIRHYDTLDPSDDAWSFGASVGPASDGRVKPDLSYWYDSIRTTTTGGYTSSFGGTSAATPAVAGVLGLIVQMWSDNVWGTDPVGSTVFERQPRFSTIKALLINNAQQYPFSGASHDLTRTHQGWGRPSARVARERAATSFVIDQDDVLTLDQTRSYGAVVAPGETELKITMVYPDPPGAPFSTIHRVNDVDLRVTSPSGAVYHGNVGLDVGTHSAPGGAANGVDTVENVFVADPEAGTWQIEVTASEINEDGHLATTGDDVAYSLVVTGAAFGSGECGNGFREPGEQCDGDDLGGATCAAVGCQQGALSCTATCTFDTAACSECPGCDDDGTCELLENCFVCPGDCASGSGAQCGNGVCETADGENCVTCPSDCNGSPTGKPSLRFCCSDGTGVDDAVTCADSRCGNQCLSSPAVPSCCGDGVCTGDETTAGCEVDCPPACEDSEIVGATCADGLDNDCDGVADCADADCALDDACCVLAPVGAACSADGQCCSNRCRGPSGRRTCK